VLAVGGGDYSVPVPNTLGPYSLREVTTDMNEVELALVDGIGDVVNVELRLENLATPRAPGTGSVSGNAWLDLSVDGDPSDDNLEQVGLEGVKVSLSTLENGILTEVETTQSSSNGFYEFTNLTPGSYRVSVDRDDFFDVFLAPGEELWPESQITTPLEYDFSVSGGEEAGPFNFGGWGVGVRFVDVKVTVWNDLSTDGSVTNENLATTGVEGVQVRYKREYESVFYGYATTGTNGCVILPLLQGESYEVQLLEFSVPEALDLRSTPTQVTIIPFDTSNVFFGVHGSGLAVELESVDVDQDAVRWTTAWEEDVLGYRLYQRALNADANAWTLVNPALVLAQGGGDYELPLAATNDDSAAPNVFSLREVTTDLTESEIARFADASPRGAPVAINPSMAGSNTLVVPNGAASVLVEPAVRLTDADEPELELLGEVLETSDGTGIYFSWPEGRRVRVW